MAKPKRPLRGSSPSQGHVKGLWLLADLAGRLAFLDDPKALMEETLESALQMFRCTSGAVCLWDGADGRVCLGPAAGKAKTFNPEGMMEVEPVREVVLGKRRPLVLAEPGQAFGSALGGWRGLAIIPIAGSGGVLGLLLVGDRTGRETFTETDTALMSALGNVVAVALETSLVHAEFRREMSHRMMETVGELSRAAAELQGLKTFNEELFQSVPVGIIVFDREFQVTFRNTGADRLWPDDRSVLVSARRTDIGRRDADWESGLRDVVNMQRPWMVEEVALERAGQETVRLNLSCSPLLSAKRSVVGGVLIIEDVTRRVHMERRLAVSERLAGVGRLAAVVAHEINNPLDGIIRLVNLSRRVGAETGDARVEKYLAEAHKGLMRMTMIVRDLLEFSRSASGSVEPMAICDILSEAAHAVAPAAEKAGVAVETRCGEELPPLKSGTLYQVVLNLMKNAIEATPRGGRVDVRAQCENDHLVIAVTDTGPGIPPEALPHLFEPFYTLKATGKGTGLGLVISRDLIEKQGGTVVAANRPQGGAVFTVRIPLATGACGCKE